MDDLFAEMQPQIVALTEPLFCASEMFVRKRGVFLPHGAVLDVGGEVRVVMTAPDDLDQPVASTEVLPRLPDSIRATARDRQLAAVAGCEDVPVTQECEELVRIVAKIIANSKKRGA